MAAALSALENLFLGLADKTRLRLLGLMAAGPVSVGHLVAETGESQPKISRHLAYLRNAGLVDTTRDGKWIYYGVADLANGSADSVFRCVVDELSGEQPLRRSVSRRDSAKLMIEPNIDEVEGYAHEEEAYEKEGPEMQLDHPSEAAHNELDVFLL